MTRQEALHELYTIFGYGFYNERVDEALNMAIKALEQEPIRCKDCKHYSNGHLCQYFSRHGTIETKETDFCSFGERRAEQ